MAATDARPRLVWLRRDLRLTDNPALSAASAQGGPIVPLFVLDTHAPVRGAGAASRWWLDKSLTALDRSLQDKGSRLILRRGDAAETVVALAEEMHAATVCWNRSYEPLAHARDEALAEALRARGVEVQTFDATLLQEPEAVRTQSGGRYGVFTPFWRTARSQLEPLKIQPAPETLEPPARWPASETLETWGLHPRQPDWSSDFSHWTPGEAGAQARLTDMLSHKLHDYVAARNRPAVDGSSGLSPHLTWGEIGPRQVYVAAEHAAAKHPDLKDQADRFLTELGWREFNYNLLNQDAELHEKPFKSNLDALKWRRSPKDFRAWTLGRTGYPLVDAGMRQLWRLGWMHNRVRLVTASFLVKHLLIDWRQGESWFWDCLVDADPANNPANWQWSAGTGADAQPFFRIFNPVAQGEKFDPGGDYVRRWVPELAKLEARWIHAPWTAPDDVLQTAGVTLGDTYPRPIVDHEAARKRALDALRAARS